MVFAAVVATVATVGVRARETSASLRDFGAAGWVSRGDAGFGTAHAHLTHGGRGRTRGAVWTRGGTPAAAWSVEFALSVAGAVAETGAGGVGVWYGAGTGAPAGDGLFGVDRAAFVGVGVVFETGTSDDGSSDENSTRIAVVQSTAPGALPAPNEVFGDAATEASPLPPGVRARGRVPFALANRAAGPVRVRVTCAADGALTVAVAPGPAPAPLIPCLQTTALLLPPEHRAHAALGLSAATHGVPYRPGHPSAPGGLACSVGSVRAAFRRDSGETPAPPPLPATEAGTHEEDEEGEEEGGARGGDDVAGAAALAALDDAAVRVQNAVRGVQACGDPPGAALAALHADAAALGAVGRGDDARAVLAACAGAQGRASVLAERVRTLRGADEAAERRTAAWLREEERREMLALHVGVDGVQAALLAGIVAAAVVCARLWCRTRTEAEHKKLY